MTDAPDFRFRADLFRIVCRFAAMSDGVRVEPGANGAGAILVAWTHDFAFAVLDASGHAKRAAEIRVPYEFMDATTRAVKSAPQGDAIRIAITNGEAMCDYVGMRAFNVERAAPPDNWRAWAKRQTGHSLVGPVSLRRDVLAAIGDASKMLARASGMTSFDADRAELVLRGGVEGAIVVAFARFPDAFAIVRDATDNGSRDRGDWRAPTWLDEPAGVLDFAQRGPAPEAGVRL